MYLNLANTTEPIKEDAAAQQNNVYELRKCSQYYYHAHKEASECEHCIKTFLSVSALRRHQANKPHVQAAASYGDNREVQRERINNRDIAW